MDIPKDVWSASRLDALHRYDILGTGPEKDFDDIVQLASRLCDVPVALVSLVAEDHQFFKSAVGVDLQGTPLEASICVHALGADSVLEIPDTSADPRTVDNPLVYGDAGVRFYAGAPLIGEEGEALGTLCVLDFEPRALDDLQREALRTLARQVVKLMSLRRTVAEAEVLRRQVDHRVRNSLQSITALTRLQARRAPPNVRAALETVVHRIQTVSALHDELYRTSDQGEVDLAAYLSSVVTLIDAVRPTRVTLSTALAPVKLEARRASAVATLVNEFVQNSFAHAFPEKGAGTVEVTGHPTGDGAYLLTLSDDGMGLEEGDEEAGGLGFSVMEACAAQVEGTYERLARDTGFAATLRFHP